MRKSQTLYLSVSTTEVTAVTKKALDERAAELEAELASIKAFIVDAK